MCFAEVHSQVNSCQFESKPLKTIMKILNFSPNTFPNWTLTALRNLSEIPWNQVLLRFLDSKLELYHKREISPSEMTRPGP